MTYDDIYTEDVLLQEEEERKQWHEENDRRIEVILAFADQVMETEEEEKIKQLLALIKREELNHNLDNSGELIFLYIAAGIYCEERKYQIYPTIFHVCSGFHDMVTLLRQVKFYFWRYQLDVGGEKEIIDYVKERNISVCVLYKMMTIANVNAIPWLKKLFCENQEWINYLQSMEKNRIEEWI